MKCELVNKEIKSNYINELLLERGLAREDIPYFLYVPDDSALEPPDNLDNIDRAFMIFQQILHTIKPHIVLVVDSDVDGFTSSAIIYQYIMNLQPDAVIDWVLHEGKGHGLSDTIEDIITINENSPVEFVIIPDAGSNDKDQHKILMELGMKCLVLDHHIIDETPLEDGHLVIVNNQASSRYTNKDLCGAGVTWQFCRYCDQHLGTYYAEQYVDLAALGIISDMMNMLSLENRYIVHTGCTNIQNYFFEALCQKQSFSMGGKVNPMTVAFYITPLINALIRVGTMDEKRRCFQAFIDGHAMVESHKRGAAGALTEVAIESTRECTNARARQNRTLDQAVEQLEIKIHKYDLLENRILFVRLDEEDFPAELNGLCAMKLAAKYQRPTIVARINGQGYDRGSSRGLNDSELKSFKQFMDKSGLFEYTAGHDNACGISIPDANLTKFHEWANKELEGVDFGDTYYSVNFERIAADNDITALIEDIAQYDDIFGQGNPEPLIHIKDININRSDAAIIGKNADTVRIEKFGITYLAFRAKKMIEELKQFDKIKLEVVGKANMNYFAGNVTPQIFIEDYEIKDDTLGF